MNAEVFLLTGIAVLLSWILVALKEIKKRL